MIKLIEQLLILSTIFIFSACTESEQKAKEVIKNTNDEKTEQLKKKNEKAIIDLNHKYGAITGWDSLRPLTYIFQEMFIDEKKTMSFEGRIKDITKSDSTYFLKVHNTGWHFHKHYMALISITSEKFAELNKQLKSTNHSSKGCFIFNVNNISSVSPEINSDFESDGVDSYSYLSFDFDETLFIFKGNLIDYHLNEIIEKVNE